MKQNRICRQITAVALAAAVAASSLSAALAAAPEVSTEETAYITLDQYGQQTDASIVKAVDLNGNTGFTDYGRYQSVVNMSTADQPLITDEGVEWQLAAPEGERFYYQVKTRDERMDIPWSIDVSYSLNGVPTAADQLAGSSGLVAVDVTVTPNPLVDEYYQNNFVLLCGALSDSGSDYSFAAPGAQVQSLGRYRVAVFMAMPREERTFHMEIGSDDFQFGGLVFASMPVTLAQAEDISGIAQDKEDIETLWNSTNSMLDDVLNIMTSMTAGTAQAAGGLRELEQARQEFDGEYETIREKVSGTRYSLKQLKYHLYDLADILDDNSILDSFDKIHGDVDDLLDSLEQLGSLMEQVNSLTREIAALAARYAQATDPDEKAALAEQLRGKLEELAALLKQLGQLDARQFEESTAALQAELEQVDAGLTGAEGLDAQSLQAVLDALEEVQVQVQAELDASTENLAEIESYGLQDDLDDVASDAGLINSELALVLDNTARTVSKLDSLLGALDKAIDGSYDHLNTGMEGTLNGTANLLESLTVALQKTQNIQANKQQITDIISGDWEKLDEEMGILDIDPAARKLSFTSARNPEPAGLQIVMRTEGITTPDEPKADVDETGEDRTVTQRLGDVFISIGNGIKNLFQ